MSQQHGEAPAVNGLHATLRLLSIEDVIALIAAQIPTQGYDVVKNNPGVYAWAKENAVELKAIADHRKGQLQ